MSKTNPTVAEKLRACAHGESAMREIGLKSTGNVLDDLCEVFGDSPTYKALYAVADAIDAEEAEIRDFCERVERAAEDREELDLFGQAYMPLPLDADGVPIRVGDEMQFDNGDTFCVCGINATTLYCATTDGRVEWTRAEDKHHKPTVEDLLEEYRRKYDKLIHEQLNGRIKYAAMEAKIEALTDMYASKLQLKEAE